jgi:hypothetical protein
MSTKASYQEIIASFFKEVGPSETVASSMVLLQTSQTSFESVKEIMGYF